MQPLYPGRYEFHGDCILYYCRGTPEHPVQLAAEPVADGEIREVEPQAHDLWEGFEGPGVTRVEPTTASPEIRPDIDIDA